MWQKWEIFQFKLPYPIFACFSHPHSGSEKELKCHKKRFYDLKCSIKKIIHTQSLSLFFLLLLQPVGKATSDSGGRWTCKKRMKEGKIFSCLARAWVFVLLLKSGNFNKLEGKIGEKTFLSPPRRHLVVVAYFSLQRQRLSSSSFMKIEFFLAVFFFLTRHDHRQYAAVEKVKKPVVLFTSHCQPSVSAWINHMLCPFSRC